jgi:hypothetical protein
MTVVRSFFGLVPIMWSTGIREDAKKRTRRSGDRRPPTSFPKDRDCFPTPREVIF